jgi:hypothetical protein
VTVCILDETALNLLLMLLQRLLGDADVITVDPRTRATFRAKALMRTRALSFYLNSVRPLHFDHYTPTPSKKGFPVIPPGLTSHSAAVHAANLAAATAAASLAAQPAPRPDDAVSTADSDLAGVLLAGDDSAVKGKKGGGEASASKGEKRKYHPKHKATGN